MPISSEPRIEDIPRIAFVTRRFHELMGLKTAAFGAGLLLGCLLEQFEAAEGLHWGPIQVLIVANGVYGLATREMDRRYRETFGDPVASPCLRANVAIWDSLWGFLVWGGAAADMFWQANRPGPSIVAVTLASWSLFIVVRDWPRRVHHLAVVAAGAAAAIVTAAVLPSTRMAWYEVDPGRAQAFLLAYTLLGVGIVAAGLFDHHLLASSLGAPAAMEDQVGLSRPCRPGLTRAAIAVLFCAAAGGSLWALSPRALGWGFPLVLIITGALSQIVVAARDIARWAREVNNREPFRARPINLATNTLVLMFVVALAAAIDCALSSPRAPVALAAAIGAWSAWIAIRDWRARKHYLIGALTSLIVVFLMVGYVPARGFALLVFAAAGALTLESVIDYWKAGHVDPI